MDDVGDRLMTFIENLPDEVVELYMEWGRRYRCWYVYPPLLHEIELDPARDDLHEICPDLHDHNAFVGIMQLLNRKRRASWTMNRFFARDGVEGMVDPQIAGEGMEEEDDGADKHEERKK